MPQTIQVTLGSGATQIVSGGHAQGTCAPFIQMDIQNNASGNDSCYLGDSTVTTSNGIEISSSGTYTRNTNGCGSDGDATRWYLAGTEGDVIQVNLS